MRSEIIGFWKFDCILKASVDYEFCLLSVGGVSINVSALEATGDIFVIANDVFINLTTRGSSMRANHC